jgi:hypothetical protein
VAVGGGTAWFVAVFVAFYLLIYAPVMMAESETLRALFEEDYPAYEREVPLFVPRLTPYRPSNGNGDKNYRSRSDVIRRFDLSQYLRHREYRAAVGFVLAYALLAAKLVLAIS